VVSPSRRWIWTARNENTQRWPQFLPDGRHFAYYSISGDLGKSGIALGELGSRQTRFLTTGARRVGFVQPGWLFFERQQSLLAQPFDFGKQSLAGEPVSIANLGADSGSPLASRFSVSTSGTVVYLAGVIGESRITWYSREGKRLGSVGEPGIYPNMTISPDGKRAGLQSGAGVAADIWVVDLTSGVQSRLTFGTYVASDPTWSVDGRSVAYSAFDSGKASIRRKPVGGGPEETLVESNERIFPQDWLLDGSLICLNLGGRYIARLAPGEKKLQALHESPFDKDEPHISPDGRWIAYNSTESGRWEVWQRSHPSRKSGRFRTAAARSPSGARMVRNSTSSPSKAR
jgi:Tol biopolymer transport system component